MFYYMAKSVFAMQLVNVCSPKLAIRTKISKANAHFAILNL